MKRLKGYEIRQMWLDFFKSKNHEVINSASLLPHDDPTLLWINAGVAPLKKYFDGREKPINPRMCNAQKSIRTNDIDNVGRTSRHHTFFEMLGNFSVGDYFRDEAIKWATELLFDEKWFGIDKNLIYITYYPNDQDTYNAWIRNGVDESHLIPLEGNFWEIGEGPCGPDTEIFFDRGVKYDKDNIGLRLLKEDMDNDRYIEIWNIVLSQFNSKQGLDRNDYPELPSKNIDTGSGLERLACIFQETDTNYETDLFLPYLNKIEQCSNHHYDENEDVKMAFRVIADHIRSVTFALADGAVISNEGRGYVLRRLVRRAIRYARKLGINKPFIYQLVSVVVDNMKQFYSYLVDKEEIVTELIKKEEINFLKTLENGEKKLSEIIKKTISLNQSMISGQDAFLLYDTFGFPIELTKESAEEANLLVDIDSFNNEMKNQKERARKARNVIQSMNTQNEDFLNFTKECVFVGYDTLTTKSAVVALFKDGVKVDSSTGESLVCLDVTPFYAEMGGQVGDVGEFIINGTKYNVTNTIKLPNGQAAHVVDFKQDEIKVNDTLTATVDEEIRKQITINHSATHLLNSSLRKILGTHVLQHGSLVNSERLRFDFNHYNNLSYDDIISIESNVNNLINSNHSVVTHVMPINEAKQVKGALFTFGEKYGDIVRVVDMGESIEFCGGTHVNNTNEIKKFAIVSIESKGSGIFRVEAITGEDIANKMTLILKPYCDEISTIKQKIKDLIETAHSKNITLKEEPINESVMTLSYKDIINARSDIENARMVLKNMEKAFDEKVRNDSSKNYSEYLNDIVTIKSNNVLIEKVSSMSVDVCKDIIDKISAIHSNIFVLFALTLSKEKVIFIAKSKNTSYNAGQIVKLCALVTLGNGGGRSDFAQSGGKDASKVDDAIEKVLIELNK